MIVPSARLLVWFAMIVLPFALLGGVIAAAAVVSLLIIGVFLLAVIVDAFGAGRSLVGIGVELPPVVRLSKDREGKVEVRIRNERKQQRQVRIALPFAREIPATREELDIILPAEAEWSRLTWSCTPNKRGSYRLDSAYVEGASPFGFWSARKTVPVKSEIRVYPNLLTERKNLSALFLHRGAFGVHAQRQVGKGRDFEKLREYIPGDSFDEVHWKATAKRGRPVTKIFQIERTQEVYVIVDASRLSARETVSGARGQVSGQRGARSPFSPDTSHLTPDTTLERFVTAALMLGLAAEQQGDLFGLLTFTDKVERFVRAKNGQAHYSACRDALYTLQPKIVTPDFDEVCSFIRVRLRRRALLVFLTPLDDPALAESFVRNMDLIRRQHLVLVNMLQPPGAVPMFTNPDVAVVDDLYLQLGGHLLWHKLRELQKVLQRRGVQFSLLQNERLSAELVSQYLAVKQRQLI
jgi:uncharacterized protein (DUF58 family)